MVVPKITFPRQPGAHQERDVWWGGIGGWIIDAKLLSALEHSVGKLQLDDAPTMETIENILLAVENMGHD